MDEKEAYNHSTLLEPRVSSAHPLVSSSSYSNHHYSISSTTTAITSALISSTGIDTMELTEGTKDK